MARNINIAVDCPDCCTCPAPTTQWDSRSTSKTKCAYPEFAGFVSSPPKRYRTVTFSGVPVDAHISLDTATGTADGGFTYPLSCSPSSCGGQPFVKVTLTGDFSGVLDWEFESVTAPGMSVLVIAGGDCDGGDYFVNESIDNIPVTPTSATTGTYSIGGSVALSDEYLTSELIAQAIAEFPAYPGTWLGTAGSFRNLSTDELSVAIREDRYRHIFPVPLVGSGTCYRLSWVERFIPEAGVALTSAEIITRGVYRPAVSSSGSGGTGLLLVAVMASDGTVSAIRILNPGSGFTSAPTITVESAINGGTTSTGWTATVAGGRVTAITGGSGGDYLPTGVFSGGGGSGATITFTLDETGGLATCPLGAVGSGYTGEPTLTITSKVSGSLAARVDLHLGTEAARCAAWDGIVPGGYDPGDNTTWPILGDGTNPYFELPVPTADGTTLVANVRAFCDCSDCP